MLAIALVAVDLLRFGIGENPSIPVDHAHPPATAAVRLMQARTPARFVGLYSPRGGAVPPLPADNGMAYGLQDARGYDYPVIKRYDRLWKAVAPPVAVRAADDARIVDARGAADAEPARRLKPAPEPRRPAAD